MLGGCGVQMGKGQLCQYPPFDKAGTMWCGTVHTGKKRHLEEKQLPISIATSVASMESLHQETSARPSPPSADLKLQPVGTLQ